MTKQELFNELSTGVMRIENLVASGKSSVRERDSLKNVLYSNVHTIMEALNGNTSGEIPADVHEKLNYLEEQVTAFDDALAEDDNQIRVLKYIMKQQGLDPDALVLEYEYENGLRERPEPDELVVDGEGIEPIADEAPAKNTKKKRTKASADSGGDEAGGGK